MFWSSPSGDVSLNFFLLGMAFLIAVFVYFFKRKIILSLFIFSLLGNIIFYIGVDYNLAVIYDLFWLRTMAKIYWPIINLLLFAFLIFQYRKHVKAKK